MMASVFALLSAFPGKEREIQERVARLEGVVQQRLLFGEQIALQWDEAHLAATEQFASWQGLREARVYHGHEAWIVKHAVR